MLNVAFQAKAFFVQIVDSVLPPRCLITGELVDRDGALSPSVWRALNFIAAPQCSICGTPFEFAADASLDEAHCVSCMASPPPFVSARAAVKYDDGSRPLVLRFKHADQTQAVRVFLPWLRRVAAPALQQADIIVPVPLHPFRLLRRRYNQAALLAQALGRETGIMYGSDILRRHRATPSQGHMGYKARLKNVRGAFSVRPNRLPQVKGKTILLIDDVITTGATINECCLALQKAGAAAVHVAAIARVVRSD